MITKKFHIDRAVTKRHYDVNDLTKATEYTQEALFRQLGAMIGEAMLKTNATLLTLTVKFNREERKADYWHSSIGSYEVPADDLIVYSVDGAAVLI